MSEASQKNIIRIIASAVFLLFVNALVFAGVKTVAPKDLKPQKNSERRTPVTSGAHGLGLTEAEEYNLNEVQKLARVYRQQGIEMQRVGNLEGAFSFYKKAIELDPFYPVPYNDMGVIYETQELYDKAEQSYMKSIQVDPNYLSAYSNLALLYENQRDLKKAAFYWEKRAQLGLPDDPWTVKAEKRLEDIHLVLGDKTSRARERQIIDLVKETREQKDILRQSDKALSKALLQKAQLYYKKGDEASALREAINAKQISPNDSEINEFIDKVQKRLLSK